MKNVLFIIVILSSSLTFAQTQKINFDLARKVQDPTMQEIFIPVMVQGEISQIQEAVRFYNGVFKSNAGNIASINIKIKHLSQLASKNFVKRIEAHDAHLTLCNDSMRVKANVNEVHSGQFPLTQGYDGKGVVIGFIDTGVDIKHPDFKDNNGKTRVMYYWDHTKPNSVNTPQPYNYGQDWDSSQINAGNCTAADTIHYGHGTFSAGTAAGNGSATAQYKGVAPQADIIAVALDFNSSAANRNADAVDYIFKKADLLGKPCVINASEGNYYGSHDGKDLEAQYIRNLLNAKPGRVFVAAAANFGGTYTHLGYAANPADTNFTWFEYDPNAGAYYMGAYGDSASFVNLKFGLGCDVVSPDFLSRAKTALKSVSSYSVQTIIKDSLFNSNNQRLGKIITYVDKYNGTYSIEFLITSDSVLANYNWRLMTSGNGKFDLWSLAVVSSGLPNAGTFPEIVKYKMPDTLQTIMTGFQCLDNVITVGNYCNRKFYYDMDNKLQDSTVTDLFTNQINHTSSIGPTRDGRIKPDVAAPGAWIISTEETALATEAAMIPNLRKRLAGNGQYGRAGGTSISSPVVAGVAALFLQKEPTATAMQVKNAITGCAKTDVYTNAVPNIVWGYGKVDAFAALTQCASASVNNISTTTQLIIFPNPFNEQTTISYNLNGISDLTNPQILIYDVLGKLVRTIELKDKSGSVFLQKNDLSNGSYFYRLNINDKTFRTGKLIIL